MYQAPEVSKYPPKMGTRICMSPVLNIRNNLDDRVSREGSAHWVPSPLSALGREHIGRGWNLPLVESFSKD